jgi:hypothetical protein
MANVEYVTKESKGAQEDAEHQHLLALQCPGFDLFHRSEEARVLGVGVEVGAAHERQSFEDAFAAVAEPAIPVGRACDLAPCVVVNDAGFRYSEWLARFGEVKTDVAG